jgi:Phage integrase family
MEQLERSKISSVLSYAQRIGFCAAKISKARATFRETMNYARRKCAALTPIFWTEVEGCRRRTREHALPKAFHALFGRIGARAKLLIPRTSAHAATWLWLCRALANAGHDTRAVQAWLGHKNIQHTVRYTELAPDRFKHFWR